MSGIQVAKEQLPDLIICDINMPNLDGYGTLTALRENEATATIPFIFLSGATDKLNMRRGMELGADDYLTKPFAMDELVARVRALLRRSQATESTTLQFEDLQMDLLKRTVQRDGKAIRLTTTEFALLE